MRRRVAIAILLVLPLFAVAGNYYRELLALPQQQAAAPKTWEFLFPFTDAVGQKGGWADIGKYGVAATGFPSGKVWTTNVYTHTNWGNHLWHPQSGGPATTILGPTNIPAPGTNDHFIEGWFYSSGAHTLTNVSRGFWGDVTNAAAPGGAWPFLYFAKASANNGRINLYGSTNGASQASGLNRSTTWPSADFFDFISNKWGHIRVGRVTNSVAMWTNGVRVVFSGSMAYVAGANFVHTNADGWLPQPFVIGQRLSSYAIEAVSDFGYYIYPTGTSASGANFVPPTSPRTGTEVFN